MTERDGIRERRQALKQTHGRLYDEVRAILFEHDPVGINFATNTDEYEPEVDTILPGLEHCRNAGDVRRLVHEEFVRWFDPEIAGEESRYSTVADEIWKAHERHEGKDR